MPRVSIIVPTRRVDGALSARLRAYLECWPEVDVLVVRPEAGPEGQPAEMLEERPRDESAAGTSAEAAGPVRSSPEASIRLLDAPRGRGTQCNAGARAAAGELLLFLHDDTELPVDALACIDDAFADPAVEAACFRLRFDHGHWLLGVYAAFSRFESVLTTFGDQALVIRRSAFDAVGGFPDWPLFEDVELARRIRRRSRIVKLPAAVTTSAVRFERNGMLRQQLLNAGLMLRFLLGARPAALAARYEREPADAGRPKGE